MTKSIILIALFALLLAPIQQVPPFRSTLVHTLKGDPNAWKSTRDGKRIYFVLDTSQLVMFDRTTGKETRLGELRALSIDVSRAGDRLAFTRRNEDGRGLNAWTMQLNPATGLTTGTPSRVSLMPVDQFALAFSPDGKSLAIAKDEEAIAIVPVNGGPERVVLRRKGDFWPVQWAPDGKSLYAGLSFDKETTTERNGIYRVAIEGGTPQLVVRAGWIGAYPGLTPNGKFIVNWKPAWDSVVVQTAGGARVTAFVPSEGTDVPDHWFDMTRGYNAFRFRPFEMSLRLSNPERTLTLPDTFGNPPFAVRWAPDGKRFAAVGRNPRNLVIVNADGSVQKRFPVSHLADFFRGIKWSPDGQRLMWTVPAAGIHVVDVTTGAELQLPSGVGSQRTNPIWRSDSKAILYGMLDTVTAAAADSTVLISLRESNLDGTERVFGSVRAQNTASVRFVSDSMALVWRQNEYRAIPLRRIGDSQVVYTREGSGQPVPSFSENGLWMAVRVAVQGERLPRRIDVMRIDGSERRTVQLDMTTLAGQENPVVSNDGRELFVLGTINGGLAYQRVDVATGRSTRIAAFQTNDRDGFSPSGLSPDGRSVVYLTALPRYTRIYEVDMSTTLTTGGSARRNP